MANLRQLDKRLAAASRARAQFRVQVLGAQYLPRWLRAWERHIMQSAAVATGEVALRALVELQLGPSRVAPVARITHVKRLLGKREGRWPAVKPMPGAPPVAWHRTGRLLRQVMRAIRREFSLSPASARVTYEIGVPPRPSTSSDKAGGGRTTTWGRVALMNELGAVVAVPITVRSLAYLRFLYSGQSGAPGPASGEGDAGQGGELSRVVGVALVRIPPRPLFRVAYQHLVAAMPGVFVAPFQRAMRGGPIPVVENGVVTGVRFRSRPLPPIHAKVNLGG